MTDGDGSPCLAFVQGSNYHLVLQHELANPSLRPHIGTVHVKRGVSLVAGVPVCARVVISLSDTRALWKYFKCQLRSVAAFVKRGDVFIISGDVDLTRLLP
jgi:hypothetical protein